MKYSDKFERDYAFYLKNVDRLNFYGNGFPKFKAIYNEDTIEVRLPAKQVFYNIESKGFNSPTSEPELLNKLLACKASVNFHIKMWASGLAEGSLFRGEIDGQIKLLEWEYGELIEYENMVDYYGFPDWVIKAILNQSEKIKDELIKTNKLPIYLGNSI